MTTKILALTDALGNLVRFVLLPGQRFDTVGVAPLIDGLAFGGLIADKAFDSNVIIADLNARGAKIVISQHPRRVSPLPIDTEIYKWRHLIENFFCNLKEFKRIAMRADNPLSPPPPCRRGIKIAFRLPWSAESQLKEQDAVVLELGGRLQNAKQSDYSDAEAWLADYAKWTDALGKIDEIVVQWQSSHRSFLDIRTSDYEKHVDIHPPHIHSNTALMNYKTLCIARDRYLSNRAGIMNYFALKANDI